MMRPSYGVASTSETDIPDWLAFVVGLAFIVGIVYLTVRYFRHHGRISESSSAIKQLESLNSKYKDSLKKLPAISYEFSTTVSTKGQFDAFGLEAYMLQQIMLNEVQIDASFKEFESRLEVYEQYAELALQLRSEYLGQSGHEKVDSEKYARDEAVFFDASMLSRPKLAARIVGRVSYFDYQSNKSVSKKLVWDVRQLQAAMDHYRSREHEKQQLASARRRERSRVTPRIRMEVLERDGYRCQKCGASSSSGAELHVDHKVPISWGGTSDMYNLQTLCRECNLGKGNAFAD